MHFTHRKHNNPSIEYGGQVLLPRSELWWLGFWLDPKLSFNAHLKKVKEVGQRTVAQLRRLNKAYSGLGPGEAKHLVTAVLRSRILYGSVVWFTTTNFSKVMKLFHTLHSAANRMILGAFKTSPTDLMAHDANLTPFAIAAVRLHHLFFHKQMTVPDNHPTQTLMKYELMKNAKLHRSPIVNMVRMEDFESIHNIQCEIIQPFPSPPWENPVGTLMNLELTRTEAKEQVLQQVAEEEKSGALVIFTDGSLSEEGGGAAAVLKVESRNLSCNPYGVTNNELELLAIGLAVAQFQDIRRDANIAQPYNAIAIFSDSQIALKRTHDPLTPTSMQYLAKSVKSFLTNLTDTPIRLYWTPGHEDIEMNELADKKAKQAAGKKVTTRLMPLSLSSLLQITRSTFHLRSANFSTGRKTLRTQPRKVADALAQLEKGKAAAILQLRSEHSPLNAYLHRFKHHDTGKCDQCRSPETVAHFLLHSRQFKQQRKIFRSRIKEEEVKVNPYSLPSLLNTPPVYRLLAQFVLETGRFRFLKQYVPPDKDNTPTSKTKHQRR